MTEGETSLGRRILKIFDSFEFANLLLNADGDRPDGAKPKRKKNRTNSELIKIIPPNYSFKIQLARKRIQSLFFHLLMVYSIV